MRSESPYARLFWLSQKGAEKQFLIASVAKANKLREVFVRKSPIERLVNWTAATKSLPDAIMDELLKKYPKGALERGVEAFLSSFRSHARSVWKEHPARAAEVLRRKKKAIS